jgi:hypothetical protein
MKEYKENSKLNQEKKEGFIAKPLFRKIITC